MQKEHQIASNMEKKANFLFIILNCIIVIISCKSSESLLPIPEEYRVISIHFERLNNVNKLFYNTITNMSTGDLLKERISIGQLNFHRFKNGLPKQVDFDTIFNTETIGYLKKEFAVLKNERIDEKLIRGVEIVEDDNNDHIIYITKPVITKNNQFSLFYTETTSSGNLWVYKKNEDGEWSFYSTSPLWIE